MTDKEFAKQQKRVERYFQYWQRALWLEQWRTTFKWHRGEFSQDESDGRTVMRVTSDYRYMQAEVEVYLPAVVDQEDEALERSVVHELSHVLLNEMHYWNEDGSHEERVATTMSQAFVSMRDALRKTKKGKSTPTNQKEIE